MANSVLIGMQCDYYKVDKYNCNFDIINYNKLSGNIMYSGQDPGGHVHDCARFVLYLTIFTVQATIIKT